MTRSLRALADTGYLISFGAIPRGTKLLGEIFSAGVGATPTIRSELNRVANNPSKSAAVRDGARAYVGRNDGVLLRLELTAQDKSMRSQVQSHLRNGTTPIDLQLHDVSRTSKDHPIAEVLEGKDAGEAEAVAVAYRLSAPLLINERAGTRCALVLGVQTESAAVSLRRLSSTRSPRELYQLYREMQRAGDTGVVVPGPQWFRGSNVPPELGPLDR